MNDEPRLIDTVVLVHAYTVSDNSGINRRRG